MLGVGVQVHGDHTKVSPQQVTGLDDGIAADATITLTRDIHRGLKPDLITQLLHALTHPPDDIFSGGFAGRDHGIGKGL